MAKVSKPSAITVTRIRRWAAKRVPVELQERTRVEVVVRGANVTLYELEPPLWPADGQDWTRRPAAQFRLSLASLMGPGVRQWDGTVSGG